MFNKWTYYSPNISPEAWERLCEKEEREERDSYDIVDYSEEEDDTEDY